MLGRRLSLDSFNGNKTCGDHCRLDHQWTFSTYNDGQCPVCLEDSNEPDTMLLPCAHAFHGDCILPWVENSFSCPMCRTEIGQFIPVTGAPIKDEFSDLWNKHYVEGIAPLKETFRPEEDDFVKKTTTPSTPVSYLPVTMEELDMLFEDDGKILKKMKEGMDELLPSVEIIEEEKKKFVVEEEERGFSFPHDLRTLNAPPISHFTIKNALLTPALIKLNSAHNLFLWESLRHSINPFYSPSHQRTQRTQTQEVKPEPYDYKTIDNFRGGASSGILTTMCKMLVERHSVRNFFPIFREVTPNVAIYFTVFEETKKYLGRPSDSYSDIFQQCFTSGCVGGFCAYLPRTHFNALVPLQFGLHFGTFEVLKQAIKNNTGRERLTVADVGSTAVAGGIAGSCVTYPLSKLFSNAAVMLEGNTAKVAFTQSLTQGFVGHCVKMSPLWATTACGFEFSRRLITNT